MPSSLATATRRTGVERLASHLTAHRAARRPIMSVVAPLALLLAAACGDATTAPGSELPAAGRYTLDVTHANVDDATADGASAQATTTDRTVYNGELTLTTVTDRRIVGRFALVREIFVATQPTRSDSIAAAFEDGAWTGSSFAVALPMDATQRLVLTIARSALGVRCMTGALQVIEGTSVREIPATCSVVAAD